MDFQQYEIIISFRKIIYTGKITSYNADKDQSHLLHNSLDFIKETKNERYRENILQEILLKA